MREAHISFMTAGENLALAQTLSMLMISQEFRN
jgi:hypothetical protein